MTANITIMQLSEVLKQHLEDCRKKQALQNSIMCLQFPSTKENGKGKENKYVI